MSGLAFGLIGCPNALNSEGEPAASVHFVGVDAVDAKTVEVVGAEDGEARIVCYDAGGVELGDPQVIPLTGGKGCAVIPAGAARCSVEGDCMFVAHVVSDNATDLLPVELAPGFSSLSPQSGDVLAVTAGSAGAHFTIRSSDSASIIDHMLPPNGTIELAVDEELARDVTIESADTFGAAIVPNVAVRNPTSEKASTLTPARFPFVGVCQYFGLGFNQQTVNGIHNGQDILPAACVIPERTSICSPVTGTVYANYSTDASLRSRGHTSPYRMYWNAFVLIKYVDPQGKAECLYLGHVNSAVAAGTIRPAYNATNQRTPSADHVHISVSAVMPPILQGWGYSTAATIGQWQNPLSVLSFQ
jgi:hypothetical protein